MVKRLAKHMGPKKVLILTAIFLLFIFLFQNTEPISVRFIFWNIIKIPKLYLILALLIVGMVVGFGMGWHFAKPQKPKEVAPVKGKEKLQS